MLLFTFNLANIHLTLMTFCDPIELNQDPSKPLMFCLQGFAAGLMLSISFLDLAHNAINSIGFLKANLWVSHVLQYSSDLIAEPGSS